jgi:mitogen-activated protein kinase kinase kinase
MSFAGINTPMTTSPAPKTRPSTGERNNHPYASDAARSQALQLPTAQQLQASLSPIAESFTSASGTTSPPTPFSVGRGPFNPMASSYNIAPSLDDLRRKLIKFMLPEEGHSCTINAEDCAGGIEVLEKVLKKFNKLPSRGDWSNIMDLVETEDGGLSVDGWGVYIDWGQGEGQGLYILLIIYGTDLRYLCLAGKPLTEGELLSICHAPPDNPARERGLTLRRTAKGKRSKALGQRANSPTSPVVLPTGEPDRDGNLLSPRHAMSFQDAQTSVSTKRASSISILSGLGVPHPEKALDPPASPTGSGGRKSPAGSGSSSKRPSKLRNFFGQRPPSELITTHLAEYFPFTEKKVLERTARHSMMRTSTIGSLGKRDSTISWNPAPPLPSRFSSSTVGDRSSIASGPPPIPDKPSSFTGEATPVTEEPPRMSLSTEDGQSIDLKGDETDGPTRLNSTPQLLPPVSISSESFSESMENLTSGKQRPRPVSKAMSIGSKRMSFMTELRSKRDVSDTASLMTVDQITASVESRRESLAVDTSDDSIDDWTKVGSEQDGSIDESPELSESGEEDSEEDEDEEVTQVDDNDDDDGEPGKAVTSKGGVQACLFYRPR